MAPSKAQLNGVLHLLVGLHYCMTGSAGCDAGVALRLQQAATVNALGRHLSSKEISFNTLRVFAAIAELLHRARHSDALPQAGTASPGPHTASSVDSGDEAAAVLATDAAVDAHLSRKPTGPDDHAARVCVSLAHLIAHGVGTGDELASDFMQRLLWAYQELLEVLPPASGDISHPPPAAASHYNSALVHSPHATVLLGVLQHPDMRWQLMRQPFYKVMPELVMALSELVLPTGDEATNAAPLDLPSTLFAAHNLFASILRDAAAQRMLAALPSSGIVLATLLHLCSYGCTGEVRVVCIVAVADMVRLYGSPDTSSADLHTRGTMFQTQLHPKSQHGQRRRFFCSVIELAANMPSHSASAEAWGAVAALLGASLEHAATITAEIRECLANHPSHRALLLKHLEAERWEGVSQPPKVLPPPGTARNGSEDSASLLPTVTEAQRQLPALRQSIAGHYFHRLTAVVDAIHGAKHHLAALQLQGSSGGPQPGPLLSGGQQLGNWLSVNLEVTTLCY